MTIIAFLIAFAIVFAATHIITAAIISYLTARREEKDSQ